MSLDSENNVPGEAAELTPDQREEFALELVESFDFDHRVFSPTDLEHDQSQDRFNQLKGRRYGVEAIIRILQDEPLSKELGFERYAAAITYVHERSHETSPERLLDEMLFLSVALRRQYRTEFGYLAPDGSTHRIDTRIAPKKLLD